MLFMSNRNESHALTFYQKEELKIYHFFDGNPTRNHHDLIISVIIVLS